MTYASEDLKNEHEGVLLGLEILEKMIGKMDSGANLESSDLADMVNFLKLFADKCHHGKEEGLLFPAMEKYGIPNAGGPIGQMLTEHTRGRAYLAGMTGAIEKAPVNSRLFIENATGYITLMRDHIAKENTILFPLGDRVIPSDVQSQLIEDFEKHEETVMGAGTHEKLHEMLHAFAKKYLV